MIIPNRRCNRLAWKFISNDIIVEFWNFLSLKNVKDLTWVPCFVRGRSFLTNNIFISHRCNSVWKVIVVSLIAALFGIINFCRRSDTNIDKDSLSINNFSYVYHRSFWWNLKTTLRLSWKYPDSTVTNKSCLDRHLVGECFHSKSFLGSNGHAPHKKTNGCKIKKWSLRPFASYMQY